MANPEQVRRLKEQGFQAWNSWREQDANRDFADLSGADFRGVDLSKVELITGNLRGANLSGVKLSNAVLLGADLRRANLSGATLFGADLRGADLSGADLRGVKIDAGTNFASARFTRTTRYDDGAQLRGFRGIDPDDLQASIERLSEADPQDVQQIAAAQMQLSSHYYREVLEQSNRSFRYAMIASAIGIGLFAVAVGVSLWEGLNLKSIVPLIAGAVVNVISGLVFVLYGKTSTQLSAFHGRLEVLQRYLLANSICASLDGEQRNKAREALIVEISRVPIAADTQGASGQRAEQRRAA